MGRSNKVVRPTNDLSTSRAIFCSEADGVSRETERHDLSCVIEHHTITIKLNRKDIVVTLRNK